MKITLIITFWVLLVGPSFARIDNIFENKTSIEKPFELRDPFQPPRFKSEASKKNKQSTDGILDNVPKPDFKFDLKSVEIVGLLVGKERRVIVKVGTATHVMREGEKFGLDGPEIKAILPGGVILVEKITNIYGEDEFIETVIPISN